MFVQAAYFLAWPTLGSAILILGDPGYDGQKQVGQPRIDGGIAPTALISHARVIPYLPLSHALLCHQVLEKAGRLDSEGQVPAEITDTKALQMQKMREAAQSTGRVA